MKGIVAVILSLCLLVVVSALSPPTAYTLTLPTSVTGTYTLLKVIGAPDLTTAGPNTPNTPTANGVSSVSRVRTIPAGAVTSGPLRYGGVVASDLNFARAVFYRDPVLNGDNGVVVFAQNSLTSSSQQIFLANNGQPNLIDVYRGGDSLYFADSNRLYYFNMTIYNAVQGYPPAATFPLVVLGNCANCSTYTAYTSGTGIAADATRVFYGNSQCAAILVWNSTSINSANNNAEPYRVYGQTETKSCSSSLCTASTPGVTCLTPFAMAIDCYGGLWVYDSQSASILHFPTASTVADFSLKLSSAPSSISMGVAPRCSYMAISVTNSLQYILNISYSGATPNGASVAYVYGNPRNTAVTPGASTSNLANVNSVSWDEANPDYLWVSDQNNNRIVYFTPFGTAAASQSFVPSASASISVTSAASQSGSRTPTPSPTNSLSNSISLTPSLSLSIGVSPSNTPSTSSLPSVTPNANNGTNDQSQSPGTTTTGGASSLSSWLGLF